mgnify:CR=1 FL=1
MWSPVAPDAHQGPAASGARRRRHGRVARFFRGYLMMVGALTTLYVLLQLAVRLLVEIGRWMP